MTVAHISRPFDEAFARDTIAQLQAAGWTDAIRYAQGPGKGISRAEWDTFQQAGMSVTLVDEGGIQQAMGGYAAGVTRARGVMAVMDTLGLPRSPAAACYYVGDDPNPIAPGAYPTIVAFFQGIAAVHAAYGGRRIGDYGSGGQINAVRARVPEVTLEWPVRSWQLSAHPNLIQEPNPTMDTLGGTIDQDTAVTADWGQWPPPTLTVRALSQEAPMAAHPTTARRDIVWATGTDHHLWHQWTDDNGDWTKGGREDLAGFGYNPVCFWTAAGHFIVSVNGVDGQMWEKESDGTNWLHDWQAVPGVIPALPPVGPPGPAGSPGPSYDDGWRHNAAAAISPG